MLARCSLVCLFLAVYRTGALTCFENDPNTGIVREVTDENYKYCVLVPKSGKEEAKLFALTGAEDMTKLYDTSFQYDSMFYKILTVCLYEKYDLGKFNPKFGRPEFMFRCMCNYDRCNSHTTFSGYLAGVQRDSVRNSIQ